LPFWEHPEVVQVMEFVCIMPDCKGIFYLGRNKDQPYPMLVRCIECNNTTAMPTQEKIEWLKTLKAKQAPPVE
jgi:hypothetical protein